MHLLSIERRLITLILDFLHFLREIDQIIFHYIDVLGLYIYLLVFVVVFSKTAFVILTFLPGDSLVFTSGTLAAIDKLSLITLFFLFIIATTLADSVNYSIGKFFSKKNFFSRLLPESAIERSSHFLISYDRVAITFSRFVPLMRTMTPFISGYTKFSYWTFLRFNFLGAILWTTVWLGSGYLLGNVPWVEENLVLTLTIITFLVFAFSGVAYLNKFGQNRKERA